ncbi:MAG: HigA family addiction module antitoxin [Nitrospirota bacterium]
MIEIKREPTHPGEILQEEFIAPLGLTQAGLAEKLKTTFRTVNEIVNKKRSVSPEMALKLAKLFGTSPELWLNLQSQYDLWKAKEKEKAILASIKPLKQSVATCRN